MKKSKVDQNSEDTFTQVPDNMVRKYGPVVAMVWSKIRRYSLMSSGVCYAAKGRLAEELGISEKTVQRSLHLLVKEGYLINDTPTKRNKPHTYRVTDKVVGQNDLVDNDLVGQNDQVGRSESPSGRSKCPSHQVKMTIEDTKKILLRENKETSLTDSNFIESEVNISLGDIQPESEAVPPLTTETKEDTTQVGQIVLPEFTPANKKSKDYYEKSIKWFLSRDYTREEAEARSQKLTKDFENRVTSLGGKND